MRLKAGVKIDKIQPQMVMAANIVEYVYLRHVVECVVTSGNEGNHSVGSLHYDGLALDFRTRNASTETMAEIVKMVKRCLGDSFDVVLEATHLHVEYDPD